MRPDIRRLGLALRAGANDEHLEALRRVRRVGRMWATDDVGSKRSAVRAAVTRQLWAWRAVDRPTRGRDMRLTLTEIGLAILTADRSDDARTDQCA